MTIHGKIRQVSHVATICAALMLPGMVLADFETGRIAEAEGRYHDAADQYFETATKGDYDSQVALGQLLLDSSKMGVKGQEASALGQAGLQWLERAAVKGPAELQFQVAELYFHWGHGQREPTGRALHWAKLAAEDDYEPAVILMAEIFRNLQIETPDGRAQAFFWMQRAADLGDIPSGLAVVRMFFDGYGVRVDEEEAVIRLKSLAERDVTEAQFELGTYLLDGNEGPRDLEIAAQHLQRAAAKDHAGAVTLLALGYYEGGRLPKDLEKALIMLPKAVRNKSGDAASYLSQLYLTGDLVPRDLIEAYKWRAIAEFYRARELPDLEPFEALTADDFAEADERAFNWLAGGG